jgi:hypothetical protein
MTKKIAWVCVAAVLLGGVAALWANREAIIPAIEARQTDQITDGIKNIAETATGRIEENYSKVKTEVRYVYEQTRTRVNALPADDVCAGLNAELALFRGMADGAGGVDGD